MRLFKQWILDADWLSWKIGIAIYFLIGIGVGELMYRGFCWVKQEERIPKLAKDRWFAKADADMLNLHLQIAVTTRFQVSSFLVASSAL